MVWELLAVESYDPIFSYDLNQCVTISWHKAPQYPIVANKEYRLEFEENSENGTSITDDILETDKTNSQILSHTSHRSHSDEFNVSKLIKLEPIQRADGDGVDYQVRKGTLTLQNNFLSGRVKMQSNGGGAYPTNYLSLIDSIFGAEKNTIEVCSKTVHDNCFTVDINPEHKLDLVVDGQTLEGIRDNTFSRWRCDPPYNEKTAKEMYGTDLPKLIELLKAGTRVVKPGSLMFLLCSQDYQWHPPNTKRIGSIYISVVPNNETRVLNIYVKLPDLATKTEELK